MPSLRDSCFNPTDFGEMSAGCPFAAIVKATTPVVGPKVPAIINDFYPRLFKDFPITKAFFNPKNQFAAGKESGQRLALGNAVVAYATNIEHPENLAPALEIICHKHCALRVAPEHYQPVHDTLMKSIAAVLGDVVTPEIGSGWSQAVMALAHLLIEKEKQLYEEAASRKGGWRGAKDFVVDEIKEVGSNCRQVTWRKADGGGDANGGIDFTAGQFLTLHFQGDGMTPRHYTITSKPGEPFLKCCVKLDKKGAVSQAVHALKKGDKVGISPPFGHFGSQFANTVAAKKKAILLSAGIGVTPMKAFLEAYKDSGSIGMVVHVDKSEEAHPYREEFLQSGVPTKFFYTGASGRPSAADVLASLTAVDLNMADCFMCGPDAWMATMKPALEKAGCTGVYTSVFGPTLAAAY